MNDGEQPPRGGRARTRSPASRGGQGRSAVLPAITVILGLIAIGAIVALLVLQGGDGESDDSRYEAARQFERSERPDPPGTFVNLPEIYGATYPDTAIHVTADVDYVADGNSNPPAGGPHWGSSACGTSPNESPPFCGPVPFGVYRDPWPPESLIHNMAHGGVAIWYNTDDQAAVDTLEAMVGERVLQGEPLVLTPYGAMEPGMIALTSWARIDKFPLPVDAGRVASFIDAHLCRFNPEAQCQR